MTAYAVDISDNKLRYVDSFTATTGAKVIKGLKRRGFTEMTERGHIKNPSEFHLIVTIWRGAFMLNELEQYKLWNNFHLDEMRES